MSKMSSLRSGATFELRRGLLILFALAVVGATPTAEQAKGQQARVAQTQDDDFAVFVKKATTKPEFLSPLVDHLPKKAGVPTPKDVLGYHIGTEKKLTYVADQQRYFRALELTSKFPTMVVENYYKKSINAVTKGADKPPHAFVIPAGQRDQTQVDRVVNLIRRQAIEVHRATGEIKVKEGTFPVGSYLVKLNQPYGPLAKTLLEKQAYPDPALTTYDDSAWTMGMANNIEILTIDDKSILEVPSTMLAADVITAGTVTGANGAMGANGAVLAVKHNGSLNLITLRYRLRNAAVKGAKAAFKVGDVEYPAGSLIIPGSDLARKEIEALGLVATALQTAPDVQTADVDLPRIAMYTTWANTEKVGWVRLAFAGETIPWQLA